MTEPNNYSFNSMEEARRNLEKIFGYPPGSFDPARHFFEDASRINRWLGEGFKLMQEVLGPEQLKDRIEALHPDQASIRLQKAAEDIMNLPRKMWELKPPPPDGFFKRR
jgi:hypothetical protein